MLLNGGVGGGWDGGWRRADTCMTESLHCSPETITALLITIPQWKIFLVLKIKKKKHTHKMLGGGE